MDFIALHPAVRPLRRIVALLILVATVASLVWLGPRLGDLPDSIGVIPDWYAANPPHALTTVVGLAAYAILLWLCAGLLFAVLASLPGKAGRIAAALARWILPRVVRRLLEISLGLTLVAGTAAPALAGPPPPGTGRPVATQAVAAPAGDRIEFGQPRPDRPGAPSVLGPLTAAPALRHAPPTPAAAVVQPDGPQPAPSMSDAPGPSTVGRPGPSRPWAPAPPTPTPATTSAPDLPRLELEQRETPTEPTTSGIPSHATPERLLPPSAPVVATPITTPRRASESRSRGRLETTVDDPLLTPGPLGMDDPTAGTGCGTGELKNGQDMILY